MFRILLLFLGAGLLVAPAGAADAKPNVLVVLCDDTGWGEFGFQGAKDIPTPHIDSIAANGVRFPQGYVSGTYCSPTRAGLMTGRYQTRFGHEFNGITRQSGLALTERTMAEQLGGLGYSTIAIGKWHLGDGPQYRPTARGFGEFYGTLANTPFLRPLRFIDSKASPDIMTPEAPGFYTTEAYAARAVDWLERHREQPWFLYLPFNAQHAPLEAPAKYLERFPGLEGKRKVFAAMMSAMDDAVGEVLGKVRSLGQEEETLIFFLSDNGGPTGSTTSANGPLRGFKAQTWEGGVRVPFCAQWKGRIPAGSTFPHPIIQLDILPTALAAAGAPAEPAAHLDGVNLLPFLTGENKARPHETLYWRFGNQWAVRHGDMKLVQAKDGGPKPLLIDLAADIGESRDLTAEQPERAAELLALYQRWDAEQAAPTGGQEKAGRRGKRRMRAE